MTSPRAPQTGKPADPQWRHRRAVKAGLASRRAYDKRRLAVGAKFATKGHAYAAGYRHGYQVAWAWWKRRFDRARPKAQVAA